MAAGRWSYRCGRCGQLPIYTYGRHIQSGVCVTMETRRYAYDYNSLSPKPLQGVSPTQCSGLLLLYYMYRRYHIMCIIS